MTTGDRTYSWRCLTCLAEATQPHVDREVRDSEALDHTLETLHTVDMYVATGRLDGQDPDAEGLAKLAPADLRAAEIKELHAKLNNHLADPDLDPDVRYACERAQAKLVADLAGLQEQ